MRLPRDVPADDVLIAIMWFRRFCADRLTRLLTNFEIEGINNHLLGRYYRETFKLEYSLAGLIRLGKNDPLPMDKQHAEAINFIVAFVRIHQSLSPTGKMRLVESLENAFDQTYGLRSLAFELVVATHFLNLGCDVTFVDLEKQGQFEFLIEKDSEHLEVECKSISADAGRYIDRKGLCLIGQRIHAVIKERSELLPRVLTIKIKRRLSEVSLDAIRSLTLATKEALSGKKIEATADYSLSLKLEPDLLIPPELSRPKEIEDYTRERIGGLGKHILLHANLRSKTIIGVIIESETQDDVIGHMVKRAKDAGEKFSRQKPSFVAMQLADMPEDALGDLLLTPNTGLQLIAGVLFEGPPRRPHVNAIAYSVLPVTNDLLSNLPEIARMSAKAGMLRNPKAKFECQILEKGTYLLRIKAKEPSILK